MYCRVCGANGPDVRHRPAKLQTLCSACNRKTPPKISRDAFDRRYWGPQFAAVPLCTRTEIYAEFYADYLTSSDTFVHYQQNTSLEVFE